MQELGSPAWGGLKLVRAKFSFFEPQILVRVDVGIALRCSVPSLLSVHLIPIANTTNTMNHIRLLADAKDDFNQYLENNPAILEFGAIGLGLLIGGWGSCRVDLRRFSR